MSRNSRPHLAREIDIKLDAAAHAIERLKKKHKSDPETLDRIEEAAGWVESAQAELRKARFWNKYAVLDSAYSWLFRVRHILCELLPEGELLPLVHDVKCDLFYLTDAAERDESREALARVAAAIGPSQAGLSEKLRHDLIDRSVEIASQRELIWHKINLMRTRLMTTLWVLAVFLLATLYFVPKVAHGMTPPVAICWYHVLAIQILGALGGALSALLTQESLDLPVPQYHLNQTLLYLRPAVGAAAGLALALLQLSGVLSVLGSGGASSNWLVILSVAFVGGFSERLFVRRIEEFAGKEKEKAEAKA